MNLKTTGNLIGRAYISISLFLALAFPVQATSLEKILQDYLAQQGLSGGVLLVSAQDQTRVAASGIAMHGANVAVTPETRFYLASAGKSIVAAAVLGFVEEGTLQLDEPVWPLIKDIDNIDQLANSDAVTLRQLLNHTSGLPDYLDDDFFAASEKQPQKQWPPSQAIAFALGSPPTNEPGRRFEYSNTNYVLLGHILTGISGSLQVALEEKVFSNARMTQSSVGKPVGTSVLAHGYAGDEFADVSDLAWASVLGDGPIVASAADLARFAMALFRDEKIIGAKLLKQMQTGSNADEGYGLGIGIDGDEWGSWFGHGGSYEGFEADFRYYPDGEVVFVFLTNGNALDDGSILDTVAESYFGE
ncbi:MAG TPA: class A beta-lactamase-related serine hydrolase [Devosia sp.]|nr:class A beta-lactamase-related serine hydrolase [Devosia sp.]